MPKQTQITKHCCIQGWSGVAEWGGVSLHHIIGLCHPLPSARYIVFYAFDNKSTSEPHAQGPGYFYGTIRLELAEDPQTILAYEMNGQSLPDLARSAASASSGNAAWFHDGEIHPRNRVHRGLQNHWQGPRRLAGRLPVFQPGGRDLTAQPPVKVKLWNKGIQGSRAIFQEINIHMGPSSMANESSYCSFAFLVCSQSRLALILGLR